MQMLVRSMAYVMTTYSSVFRKTTPIKILWIFDYNIVDEQLVEIPKDYQDNYKERCMRYFKESISLIDKGYSNGRFTDDVINNIRCKIRDYQLSKNEVWD
jgi:hypothetical protein